MKFSNKIIEAERSAIRLMFEKAKKTSINLGMGMPECKTSQNIKEAAISAINNDKTFYTPNQGIFELREEIANDYNLDHQEKVSVENVFITVGVAESLFLAMFSILDEGDEVLLPNPGYAAYRMVAKMLNCKIQYYDLRLENEFSLISNDIKNKITNRTKLIVFNSPSNPTGGINYEKELREIANVLNKENVFIFSDEVYSNLNYYSQKISSITQFSSLDKVLYFSGISKEFAMTGWRVGWTITSKEIISQLLKAHQVIVSCATSISQYAALEAVKSRNREVIEAMSINRIIMSDELSKFRNIKYCIPQGGIYYFVDFSYFGDDVDLANKLLDEVDVITVPGSAFGSSGKGFLRLSFGAKPDSIKLGLERIRKFLEK